MTRRVAFTVLAIVLTAIAGFSLSYLQQRFDAADLRNATEMVRSYHAGSGRTIEEIIQTRHARSETRPTWDAFIRSGCFGYIRVRCRAPSVGGREKTYLWDVDMGSVSIHPANPAGRDVLAELTRGEG